MVIVSLSRTIQKFASKTTCRGPFCGSTARGDSRTTTPAIETEPVEVMVERMKDDNLFKSDIICLAVKYLEDVLLRRHREVRI